MESLTLKHNFFQNENNRKPTLVYLCVSVFDKIFSIFISVTFLVSEISQKMGFNY